ncbi:Hypothetical protein CINCED_3A000304 [Cinara cedri]|uniref:Uncharacterized protein n=1 Tax=Cinara cedri TaxID=506608 RepID=A0A5E4NMF2_9HEMI|nr:Hypothetical protein CINCED_3A000304 [Cinara cedri]
MISRDYVIIYGMLYGPCIMFAVRRSRISFLRTRDCTVRILDSPARSELGDFPKGIFVQVVLYYTFERVTHAMGKVRRYKKKLAKTAAGPSGTAKNAEHQEKLEKTYYLDLAEDIMNLKGRGDKMSVSTVVKNLKYQSGEESFTLKKEHKRNLRHAFLIKKLEKNQKRSNKKKEKKKSDKDDGGVADTTSCLDESKLKVMSRPAGNTNNVVTQRVRPKKYIKGFQRKQNAILAKNLVLYSKKIKLHLIDF